MTIVFTLSAMPYFYKRNIINQNVAIIVNQVENKRMAYCENLVIFYTTETVDSYIRLGEYG